MGSGGFLMIPLLFCSLFAHAIILERLYNLRRAKLMPDILISRIYKIMEKGSMAMALSLCDSKPGPLTRLLRIGIENRNLDKDSLWAVLNLNARVEKVKLQKYLRVLAFLGALAVLIGLLGTVSGMFISFGAIWKTDRPDSAAMVATGISHALLTTAAGLVVALPAIISYSYFMAKANRMIDDITRHCFTMVRLFTTGSLQIAESENIE